MNDPTAADFDRLAALTHEDFAPRIDQELSAAGLGRPFQLVEVTDLYRDDAPPAARRPFSLLFTHPEQLPQRAYVFDDEELGRLPIFLVPVGRRGEVFEYEAVFQ